MKKILLIFILLFLSCSDTKKAQVNAQGVKEEPVAIEQTDETTQISDSNLPLPVEDSNNINNAISPNESIVSSFYMQKCASCHGKRAELKYENARILNSLDEELLTQRLSTLQNDKDHNLNSKQISPIVNFIKKKNNE
ncbi:cytochrome c [Campylobacter sp. LR264d]|uniref:cytochrome c n=1 Tax=Campylobacter sp. LR264d TaxID=2593544 RepID=UPI001239A8E9|nr:cytochrome c [Campylobacter sp. LR264d]KAA6231436.1 cytochrome c [Campylobacter sp. LR264d]